MLLLLQIAGGIKSVGTANTFFRNEMLSKQRVKAWLLFFIALHDIGKFDIRFQYKSAESWLKSNRQRHHLMVHQHKCAVNLIMVQPVCIGLTRIHFQSNLSGDFFSFFDAAPHPYESWFPWVEAVTGHHGFILHSQDCNRSRVWKCQLLGILCCAR
ncbi:HD domain-containing protein [Escherichia coli]